MLNGFYALCNHIATEGLRQANDPFGDGQVFGVFQHVADKALVDFEDIGGQAFEVGQRRIARTKIVQRKGHPKGAAVFHEVRHIGNIIQCGGFEHFKL